MHAVPRRSEMLKIVSPISRRELLAATMGVVGAGRAGWGRVYTARDWGVLRWDMGASWIQGTTGNPPMELTEKVTYWTTDPDTRRLYLSGRGRRRQRN